MRRQGKKYIERLYSQQINITLNFLLISYPNLTTKVIIKYPPPPLLFTVCIKKLNSNIDSISYSVFFIIDF